VGWQFSNATPALPGSAAKGSSSAATSAHQPRGERLQRLWEAMGSPEMMGGECVPEAMYTDRTAVALLLLTATPLLVVVATAAFFIWRQKSKR
jgi:hypothetical protein